MLSIPSALLFFEVSARLCVVLSVKLNLQTTQTLKLSKRCHCICAARTERASTDLPGTGVMFLDTLLVASGLFFARPVCVTQT